MLTETAGFVARARNTHEFSRSSGETTAVELSLLNFRKFLKDIREERQKRLPLLSFFDTMEM